MRRLSLSDAGRFDGARGEQTRNDSRACPDRHARLPTLAGGAANTADAPVAKPRACSCREVRRAPAACHAGVAVHTPGQSKPLRPGSQLDGGGHAQQVSGAAYERRQERTQCRRGCRGNVPLQRSAIDRLRDQNDFHHCSSKASPEVAAHQTPLAQACAPFSMCACVGTGLPFAIGVRDHDSAATGGRRDRIMTIAAWVRQRTDSRAGRAYGSLT